jgi:hypothetical protein
MNRTTATLPVCFFMIFTTLLLAACADAPESEVASCESNGIQIIPTATRATDPDLFSAPNTSEDGASNPCPPVATSTANAPVSPPTQFVSTEVVNLSLDAANQDLVATAVGDDMLAVAWLQEDGVYVALSRGGNHFQVRRVDAGVNAHLMFSRANRLHLVTEVDGRIHYRAADQGTHPADVKPLIVSSGENPHVVVDQMNWAHVLFVQDGRLYSARHLSGQDWQFDFAALRGAVHGFALLQRTGISSLGAAHGD